MYDKKFSKNSGTKISRAYNDYETNEKYKKVRYIKGREKNNC